MGTSMVEKEGGCFFFIMCIFGVECILEDVFVFVEVDVIDFDIGDWFCLSDV